MAALMRLPTHGEGNRIMLTLWAIAAVVVILYGIAGYAVVQ